MDDICIGLRTHILYPYYSTICGCKSFYFLLFTLPGLQKAKGKRQKSTSLILSIIQSTIGQYGAIKKLRKKKKLRLVFTKYDLLAF